ncbi:uncharacterized protein B0I36DRAFT_238609 [Microdochium trichocladiopsis]|uniref:Ion transport domain-containing protein n=1 Tax=Microdochium trichocladiopsis TaxID=1682393 RepID=A0A9P8YCV2_9PEZI|nr:uncharacterized protein B0I36DRAFT_238609 [Microdochium trichocladiopsis]KAH7035605.1 hypothetical protein B0I36DRAFT_238609 [Microdochium trichocladiopsis]
MHSQRADQNVFRLNADTPSPGPATRAQYNEHRHATADFTTEADDDDDEDDEDDEDAEANVGQVNEQDGHDRRGRSGGIPRLRPAYFHNSHEGRRSSRDLLPLFSASHLDALPVYSIVHAIRIIVQTRTETTLTWDQIRSPQVSQFLIKPMQQQIRTQHFNRATLYALMANSLQFAKEAQLYPGNAGVSGTRAQVCEVLALRLLKEYSTRELIDALSYDFYPLQGVPDWPATPGQRSADKARPPTARSSTFEVAIRASAKHFLSHPLVVQQLEAIWNGAICFYSSQDSLHRKPPLSQTNSSSQQSRPVDSRTPLLTFNVPKEQRETLPVHEAPVRRTVSLYDPRNASLFKLSRLRVPRYRQFLSTASLFILICLFIAVLIQRPAQISLLELIFWFWSAGFMLDEVVGFNEQGFSLYIMSFWNVFDLGILLLLVIYYCMRAYGVFLIDSQDWNDMAFDVLAANAILLLPRIFSVLDHYPYFSQLLIAMRLMAVDLAAVFVLIVMSCSGFFVFFTFSRNNNNAADVGYRIFQILMGFTPAAWDAWDEADALGKALLVIFLIICHFVIVTVLITVLTNSFMRIASNAKEEHQFLFAINTISMVKNDSLFSYIAPSNILAWMLMPLRYVMPIRQFVMLNRNVIKATHFPLLFGIFFYERYLLASTIYEPTDLVDNHTRRASRYRAMFADPMNRGGLFSPNIRAREESVAGMQKDRALEEVFRRPPDMTTLRSQRRQERRKTQTAIRNWMDQNDEMGDTISHWPTIDTRRSISQRRLSLTRDMPRGARHLSDVRSTASDPADLISNSGFPFGTFRETLERQNAQQESDKDHTDADGDDELVTNDEDEDDHPDESQFAGTNNRSSQDYFSTPLTARRTAVAAPSSMASSFNPSGKESSPQALQQARRAGMHNRTLSTNTILYAPQEFGRRGPSPSSISEEPPGARSRPRTAKLMTTIESSGPSGTRSPRKTQYTTTPTRPKPIPSKSVPNRSHMPQLDSRLRRQVSSSDMDINSEIGLDAHNDFGAVPASFATQMAMATGQLKGLGRGSADERDNADRMSRLVLARMKTLEEGLADVAKNMRVLRSVVPTAQNSGDDGSLDGLSSGVGGPGRQRIIIPAASHGDKRKSWTQQKQYSKGERSRPTTAKTSEKSGSRGSTDANKSPDLEGRRKKRTVKGKEIALQSSSDDESGSDHFVSPRMTSRRGSSF